jgi:hypothetical protein
MGFDIEPESWPHVKAVLGVIELAKEDAAVGDSEAQQWLDSKDDSPGSYLYYKELLREIVFARDCPPPHPPQLTAIAYDTLTPEDLAKDFGYREFVEARPVTGIAGILADESAAVRLEVMTKARDRARAGVARRYCLTVAQYVRRCRAQNYRCAVCGVNVQERLLKNPRLDSAWLHFPSPVAGSYGCCEECL